MIRIYKPVKATCAEESLLKIFEAVRIFEGGSTATIFLHEGKIDILIKPTAKDDKSNRIICKWLRLVKTQSANRN